MPLPDAVVELVRARAALTVATTVAARRAVDALPAARAGWAAAWPGTMARLVLLLTAAQRAAAAQTAGVVEESLAQLGHPGMRTQGRVDPAAFAGSASDGRPLDSLVDHAGAVGLRAWTSDDDAAGAQSAVRALVDVLVATQLADVGRAAVGVQVAATPGAGWVRLAPPPACARCLILTGKWFRWNTGFARHPRCFPAGVVVGGPVPSAAARRWYEGELVVVTTAGGQQLPVTGNHPVLTDRGWVPAHLLVEGDHVVRCLRGHRARPLVVPDHDQVPSRIEDVWGAYRVDGLVRMPTAPEDFHGDGGHGQVDVVLAHGLGRHREQAALGEPRGEPSFAVAVEAAALLAALGAAQQLLVGLPRAAHRRVGGGGLGGALLRAHAGGTCHAGLGAAAHRDPGVEEHPAYRAALDAVAGREGVLALSGGVGLDQSGGGRQWLAPRWDAPAAPFSVESRATYAGRGLDLLQRLAGQVAADRVVAVGRRAWSGHVYNLTSPEGWFAADGLIVSNCDCHHVPAMEYGDVADAVASPEDAVRALSRAEQDRVLGAAGAQAVRDGADVVAVVNARRRASGMGAAAAGRLTAAEREALAGGRVRRDAAGLYTTTEGMSARGEFARGWRTAHGGTPPVVRLMPESIYELAAGDRAEALRLLRAHGYLR